MTETSDRYRKVADDLSQRVAAVPLEGWERPSPCDGWTARDVVAHLVESTGMFLDRAGVTLPEGPSAAEDPQEACEAARAAMEEPNDEMMRQGTAFGPRVDAPDDADEQTKLLAFTGRRP